MNGDLPVGTEPPAPSLAMRVGNIQQPAERIKVFELYPAGEQRVPRWEVGSHVRIRLPSGRERRYSLVADDAKPSYTIAVLLEQDGCGGSRELHQEVRTHDVIFVSQPANGFPLRPHTGSRLFIAGGIGITAIGPMVAQVRRLNEPLRLVYCVKTREAALFCEELAALERDGLATIVESRIPGGSRLDLRAVIASLEPGTDVYCCGPPPLMEDVRAIARTRPDLRAFFESFVNASPPIRSPDIGDLRSTGKLLGTGGLAASGVGTLVVKSTGERLAVPEGASLLETLEENGLGVPSSCRAGTCGTCRVRYLEGRPVHHDYVLSEAEQSEFIMVCVGECGPSPLVLDL